MNAALQALLTFVLLYRYAAIFLITFWGSVGAPLPAGSVVIASTFFATQGFFDLPLVFLTGAAGSILGDCAAYWLVRRYGEAVVTRLGLRRATASHTFRVLEERLRTHPRVLVFVSRFVPFLCSAVNVLAGLSKVNFSSFFPMVLAGETADALFLCAVGLIFGDNWQAAQGLLGNAALVVGILIALIIVLLWNRTTRRRQARSAGKNAPSA